MRIRSLRLEQFKKFDRPVLIDGFADGLNLIAGPNEMGKSTLLLALRAALFERHGSKAQAIRDFQPNHVQGAAPAVLVELDIEGGRHRIEKRFLRRAMARLELPDGRVIEGGEAEIAIRRLLHLDPDDQPALDKASPGHFGVTLIPQTHSFHQPSLSAGTRHSLQDAISVEIDQLGSQSEVESVQAEVDAALFEIVDRRSAPKGRYKDVEARLSELDGEIGGLRRERDELDGDIRALNDAAARLRELGGPGSGEAMRAALEGHEARRAALARRREAEHRLSAVRHQLAGLVARRDQRQKLEGERLALTGQEAAIAGEQALSAARLAALEADIGEHRSRLQSLSDAGAALVQRRRHLEQLGDQLGRLRQVESALGAIATEVTLDLDRSALERVQVNGEPVERASAVIQVTDGLEIGIQGVGRIRIEPKIASLQGLHASRAAARERIDQLLRTLDLERADPEAIEVLWQGTATSAATLDADRRDREQNLAELAATADQVRTRGHGTAARRQQIEERLAALAAEVGEDAAPAGSELDAEIAAREADLLDARRALDALAGTVDTFADPAAALDRLDREIDALRKSIDQRVRVETEARLTVKGLSATVAVRAGHGLDERLEERLRRRELLARERAAYQLDLKALSLLKSTLASAANDAKAAFHAPLAARLEPYIATLLPGASPEVTPDFGIKALRRGGAVDERFEQLSDGTREQIAVLARLAFADMLNDQGLPAFVILDDALVFADDRRLDRVFAILEKAAERLQIVILTCREDRFASLGAKRLRIESLAAGDMPTRRAAGAT